ncbi:MAG: ABC transporter ATP-binding protein [Clostridia bacterium]|nr:ABC transporter ATP-binding protein [Clostridia bacterium]
MIVKNLYFAYGDKVIFDDFNLELPCGEVVCIMGASGGGKTTLLDCIAGKHEYRGEILYGQNGAGDSVGNRIAYVFQQPRLIPSMSVEKNIDFVLPKSMSKEQRRNIVNDVIQKLHLDDCAKSYPANISGGQASRAALARAFAVESDVLLMDEPFKGLDIRLKNQILEILTPLLKDKTAVFVTHDIEEALAVADTVYILDREEGKGLSVAGREKIGIPRENRDVYSEEISRIRQKIFCCLTDSKIN